MNIRRTPAILAALSLSMIAQAHAESTIEIPEVAVAEKAYPVAMPFGRDAVVEREDIEARHAPDGNALLYGQPGLKLSQAQPGTGSGITLKGAAGAMGLVTFDGIPLFGNFAAYFSFQNYPLNAIERIQIVPAFGAQQTNSRTLGGAIELNSRRMKNGAGSMQIEAGSHQWLDTGGATGIGSTLGDVTLAAGWHATLDGASQAGPQNGGVEGDDHRIGHVLANIGNTFERGDIFASLYYVDTRADSDGPALKSGRVLWWDDPNGWATENTLVGQVRGRLAFNDRWESTLQVGGTRDRQDGRIGTLPPALGGPISSPLDSSLWLVNWNNRHRLPVGGLPLDAATFSWGMEVQEQQADSGARSADERLFSPSLGLSADVNQWSVYSRIRRDQTRHFGGKALYAVGAEWHPAAGTRLWANQGSNFRAPGVNERLHPLFGNNALKPEDSHGWDAGVERHFGAQTTAQLALYRQHYHNLIIMQVDPATAALRAGNMADATVTGLDVTLRQTWTASWSTRIAYGYMNAENWQTGKSVQARPRNKISAGSTWRLNDALKASLDIDAHDGFWFENAHRTRASSVVKLGGSLDYTLNPASSVYLRAENLTDDDTSETNGFAAPGRAFYIGLRSRW